MNKKRTKEENQARLILRLKDDVKRYQEWYREGNETIQSLQNKVLKLNEIITRQEGIIDAYISIYTRQSERIERLCKQSNDEDYDANDLKNILKNNRPSNNAEMTEEEINRLIEEKRPKNR